MNIFLSIDVHSSCICCTKGRNAMTHSEMVSRAEKWLRNTLRCRVVLTELVALTPSGETPDAIGWVNGQSVLVEAKTSRSDFQADRKKRSRRGDQPALGNWRLYLTSEGLLKPEEIPEGWGLYEIHGKRILYAGGIRYKYGVAPFKSCPRSEIAMLVSALARVERATTGTRRNNSRPREEGGALLITNYPTDPQQEPPSELSQFTPKFHLKHHNGGSS